MKSKTVVTISRRWDNPHIQTTISTEGIQLQMSISDFEEALLQEIGNITLTFTKKQLKQKIHSAIESVLQGIKEESAKVV